MQRNLIIVGVGAIVIVAVAAVAYIVYLQNADTTTLAQLDRVVRSYDGEYADASYDPADDRLVVTGLVLRNVAFDEDVEPLDVIEIGSLDVAGLVRSSFGDAIFGGREQNILSSLIADDLALTEDGQTIQVSRIELRDVSVGPLPDEISSPEDLVTRAQVLAAIALRLHAERIGISGFASPPEGPTGMRFDNLVVSGLEGGQLGTLELEGLSLWDEGRIGTVGDTVRLAAARTVMEDLDARTPLRRTAAGEILAFNRQSDIPLYAHFLTEGVRVEDEASPPLTLTSFEMHNDAYEGPLPTQSRWTLTDLRVPLDAAYMDESESIILEDLGYEELLFSFHYEAGFDLDTGSFELTDVAISVADMGAVRFGVEVADIPFTADMIDQTAGALLDDGFVAALLEQATLRGGRVVFTDAGIVERVVNQNAARADMTPEAYIDATIADLATQRREVASSDLAVQTIDALIAFFGDPTSISVVIAPDEPVPASQIFLISQINPFLLVELLNLRVAAGDIDE